MKIQPGRTAVRLAAAALGAVTVTALLSACISYRPLPAESQGASSSAAPAGEIPAGYEDFYTQSLNWESCDDAECATAVAPLDWDEPEGETIDLPVVRQAAANGNAMGSLFVNPGGPGGSAYDLVKDTLSGAVDAELSDNYDIIGLEPRGVSGDDAVTCFDDDTMLDYLMAVPEDPYGSDGWVEWSKMTAKEFADACAENTGDLLGAVDTASAAKDMDMMRAVLGDEKLNYLGYSYGTHLGASYADQFPDNVGKLVLDGAVDPQSTSFEQNLVQAEGFESALTAYLENCIAGENCPFTGTVDEAKTQIQALMDKIDAEPLAGSDGRELGISALSAAINYPLYSEASWPILTQLFTELRSGGTSTLQYLAESYFGIVNFEAFYAINCLDYTYTDDLDQMAEEAKKIAEAAPTIGRYWGYGDLLCSQWAYKHDGDVEPLTAEGADPIVVIGTTNDPATPFSWAEALSKELDSGVLVTYEGEGHTAYNGGNECIQNAVDKYFLEGVVPEDGLVCS